MSESELHAKLRSLVIEQIKSGWVLWRNKGHGPEFTDMNNLPSKRSFYLDLQIDIHQVLAGALSPSAATGLIPSLATIDRFLDPKSDSGYGQKTLDAFALYAGFNKYADFRAEYIMKSQPLPEVAIQAKQAQRPYFPPETHSPLPQVPESGAKEFPAADKTSVITVIRRWKLLYLLAACLVAVFAGSFIINMLMPDAKVQGTIPFNKFVFEVIHLADSSGPSRALCRYDFSALGIDTLKMEFESSMVPRVWILTKQTDTIPILFYNTASKIYLSAKGQEDIFICPMGGASNWHYTFTDLEPELDKLSFRYVAFAVGPYLVNGHTTIPDSLLPFKGDMGHVPNLSSFGRFPEISLSDFSLELKYRFPGLGSDFYDIEPVLFTRKSAAAEFCISNHGTSSANYVIFGDTVFMPRSDLGKLEVKNALEWNIIRLNILGNKASLFCNDTLLVSYPYKPPADNRLWGIELPSGANIYYDYLRIKTNAGKLLYAQEFNNVATINALDSIGKHFIKVCGY